MTPEQAVAATEAIWAQVDGVRLTPVYPFRGLVGFGPILVETQPPGDQGQWAIRVSRETKQSTWIGLINANVVAVLGRPPANWEIEEHTTGLQLALACTVRPGSCVQRRVGNVSAGPASSVGARVKVRASDRFLVGSGHALANFGRAAAGDEIHLSRPSSTGPADTLVGHLGGVSPIDFSGRTSAEVDAALIEVDNVCSPLPQALCFDGLFGTPTEPQANEMVSKCGAVEPWLSRGKVRVVGGYYEVTFPIFVDGKQSKVWFKDQISIDGTSFAQSGDSGSLVVSDDGNYSPYGLLMSGSANGVEFVANKIANVFRVMEIREIR